ncbi:hypothetical protein [Desulfovibrio ferrophilus]|uniref:Negative regulator of beta-lactamase expression-like protein n=1 Tax=Desulfovibrio ferrophilus TaxID=241368 RepID=A0A2Z6AWI9_9BACT|nr:hypothetical protein [Desulfovibrio ferrophilus]BBD07546.1 Negative regulator of beta-lactamase expression-like protein [Desulfovibrio ferrophilus]
MRKSFVMIFLLLLVASASVASTPLETLKAEAAKGVGGNVSVVDAEQDEEGLFVTCMKDGFSYQFTISSDMESGVPEVRRLKVEGRQAEFFDAGVMGAKGLLVQLASDRSLVLLVVDASMSGKGVSLEFLREVVGRMNLDLL